MDGAGRELTGLAGGDVDRPQAVPDVLLGGRPRVVLILLAPLPLVALRLAGDEGDRLAVRRPLEIRDRARSRGERDRLPSVRSDEPDLALRLVRVVLLHARARPLGKEREPLPVGRPARLVVAHRRGGERASLAARPGDEPDIGLIGVLARRSATRRRRRQAARRARPAGRSRPSDRGRRRSSTAGRRRGRPPERRRGARGGGRAASSFETSRRRGRPPIVRRRVARHAPVLCVELC